MKHNNIDYLSDRLLLSDESIPESLLDQIRASGLISPDMVKIHFCGVISYHEGLAVFLPRNHNVSKESAEASGHLLLQALLKYYQTKDSGIYAQESGEEVIGGRSLSLAVSLLDDFRSNGLYLRRIKQRTTGSGRVNWSRTINQSTPYSTENGPMYLELFTSRSRYISNCETARIHSQVIKELFGIYGALWLGVTSFFDDRLELMPKPLGSTEGQIAYLQSELQLTYSERDMILIKGLIQYLNMKKGTDKTNVLIGVRKFHTIWESMLDECLIGKYAVNSKLPVPVYQTANGDFIPVARKGQRTDTVLRNFEDDRFAVVDAKYYDASSPANAPGWPDLVKQFYYHEALSTLVGEHASISNHFIFPGCDGQLKAAYVAERGKNIESKLDCLEEYSTIYCHYQAPIELLEAYVEGKKLAQLTEYIFATAPQPKIPKPLLADNKTASTLT
jgi:hypothetical protein